MNQIDNKIENVPSLGYVIGTFFALLLIPLLSFGIAFFAYFHNYGKIEWGPQIIVFALGTIPGLILGVRYLKGMKSKIIFGISYIVSCFGLLFVERLMVACAVVGTCL